MREQIYRGFRIRVDRQPTLGGEVVTSVLVERNDGLVIIDDQTEATDIRLPKLQDITPEWKLLVYTRSRIDKAIATKGESEMCEECWGRWKEPKSTLPVGRRDV